MASQSGRKTKAEPFSYSWFMPAPGGPSQPPSSVPQAQETSEEAPSVERPLEAPRVEAGRVPYYPSNVHPPTDSGRFGFLRLLRPRPAALVAWSAIAAVGMAELLIRSGPSGAQFGAIAGTWAGVSAAIWFFTSMLPGQGAGLRRSSIPRQ